MAAHAIRFTSPIGVTLIVLSQFQAQIAPDLPKPPEQTRQRLAEPQLAVDLSPDGTRIVCSGQNQAVRQWSFDGAELASLKNGPGGWSVSYSPDGRLIVGCGLDRTIRLWEAETGRELRHLDGHTQIAWMAQFLPGGEHILSVGEDGTIRIWAAYDGKEIGQFMGHPGPIWCMALSPDGHWLATGGSDGVMRLWDMSTGRPRRTLEGSHGGGVGALMFSPDSRTLASTGWQDQKVFLWEVATARCRRQIPHDGGSKALVFPPHGNSLITAGNDKNIRVWDLCSGKELPPLEGHKGTVNGLALSRDGQTLVSVSNDNTVRTWNLSSHAAARKPVSWPARQLEAGWSALARVDAKSAFDAVTALAASPEQTLAFLRDRLRPSASPNVQKISALIADTNHGQYAVRQAASFELQRLGEEAESHLLRAVREPVSLESKRRAERVLKSLESRGLSAETLRAMRAVELLERIGGPDARHMLEALAAGAPDTRLTLEAQASLRRMPR
jgi:WD domain, G-beta repeat